MIGPNVIIGDSGPLKKGKMVEVAINSGECIVTRRVTLTLTLPILPSVPRSLAINGEHFFVPAELVLCFGNLYLGHSQCLVPSATMRHVKNF